MKRARYLEGVIPKCLERSGDDRYSALARRILKETTRVSVEDLQWRPDPNAYLNKYMPNMVQQAATLYGLQDSVRRSVAEKGWEKIANKVLLPTTDYKGTKVLTVVGSPANPVLR